MAAFNLTAELNIRGPSNLNRVVADIRRQLSTVSLDVNINPNTSRGIQAVTRDVRDLSAALRDAQANAVALGTALRGVGSSLGNAASSINNVSNSLGRISTQSSSVSVGIKAASSEMAEFGKQSALAIRRFAAFSVATGAVYALGRAVTSAYAEFVNFNKEFVRLQQVTDTTKAGLTGLSSEITRLSTNLGVNSSELLNVSVTLAQAGLSAGETKQALEALAKSALAPSFDSLNDTVEGSIALMRQFGISSNELESALGSVNAVAAKFAVEAGDIITAIQRTGGVFAAASKGVSEGKDALNEFLAVFTSVRATTRESAETIATGLRTIFTRIQRTSTVDALKDFGITLTDLEGKFVGPFEAVRRLSEGLKSLDPRDLRFSQIVEELGGFRQIGKVIPLIQQFATAQQALSVAQKGSSSLANDAATAQESLAVRITKVREQFIALVRDIGQSASFQAFADVSLKIASALISVADAAKDVLPAITAIAAIRGVGALGQFFSGFSGGVGRRPRGFATGGFVPGSGNSDTVPAMLTPGEFVIRKKAVSAIGLGNLQRMNGYNRGGRVQRFARGGIANAPMIDDILQTSGAVLPRPSAIDALIRAGGGAVDIDRTIKRTIGDKAYAKAPSAGSQKNVLARYFADDMARLKDIQSAPLTSFGKSLQEAIRSGQLKGNRVSIISKSRRTKGVPEYLSQLFGIPIQNMIFTQGQDKQPAIDAIRSKGPRIDRVGRFNLGGLVQKFADGGLIEDIKSGTKTVGAAILEVGDALQGSFSISKAEIDKVVGYKTKNLPQLGQFKAVRQGLKPATFDAFDEALDEGIIQGVNTAASLLTSKLSLPAKSVGESNKRSFLNGINDATRGNLFEDVLLTLKQGPGPFSEREAQQPFDFPDGLSGTLGDNFGELPSKWVDAKASYKTAQITGGGSLESKTIRQLKNEIMAKAEFYKDNTSATKESEATPKTEKISDAILADKLKTYQGADFKAESVRSRIDELGFDTTQKEDVRKFLKEGGGSRIPSRGLARSTILKFLGVEEKASGGSIDGEDTVPALLTPGEFVINKKAASRLGISRLNQLNKADKIKGYNKGGVVQRFAGGGMTLPARSTDPTNANTTAVNTAIAAIREMSDALEGLGVSASSSARLIEAGGAISISASERALQQDVNRLRIAGASATDIYRAEQRLATIREENANKLNAQQIMSGATGGTLQDIQTRAERERERLLDQRRATMAARGRSGAEIEETLANDTRYQDYVRRQSYETATTQVTGASTRMMRDAGVTGSDIEQYINQSMMDRRTLAQMDAQLRQTREQELRNSAAYASASASEQRRMIRELRARNNEEITERRNIVSQLARDRGLTSSLGGQIGRGIRTTGALFGMGSFAENEAMPGGGLGGRLNRFSAGAQRAGFGLSLAGGMIGDTIGNAVGGKTGAGIGAASAAFASSVGVGAMFGPIGALTGVVVGATSAIKAWTDAVSDATLAEEQSKTEQASLKIQRAFEKLEKSTNRAESTGAVKDIADQLKNISGSFSRSGIATADKMAPATGITGAVADFNYSAINTVLGGLEKVGNFIGARLGLNEDRAANFNGFTRQIDTNQLGKEIGALARNSQVIRDLPQLFEQGLRKGQTFAQIEAQIGPDSLASLKEIFAVSQGNEMATSLMAQRAAATQELNDAVSDEERERLKQRIANLNILISRIAETTFNNDIKKSIVDKLTAEKKLEEAAASATIKINLFAEALKDISAAANKAGVEFEAAQRQIEIGLGSAFGDQIKIAGPDRRNENVLENIRAYSLDTIRQQIAKTGADFGFNPAITKEAQTAATNKKILDTELPKILAEISAREKGGFDPEGSAGEVIKKQLKTVLAGRVDNADAIINNLVKKITEKLQSRQGITVEELLQDSSALNEIMSADSQTLEVFGNLVKEANDKIANITSQLNRYSAALNQATELQVQRENVGIEGENQLRQALGQNLTLSDMNAAFENSIDILTSRIGADGRAIRGTGTLDPAQVMQRMLDKEAEAANIQKQLDQEKPPIDSARFKELNSSLARTTAEARNLQTAHQKLASDSSRASNALAKISELRQQNEARQSMFLEVLKNANNPEWQMDFVNSVNDYQRVMGGQDVGPDGWARAVQGLEYALRANPREAKEIQDRFIENASKILGQTNPELQQLLPGLIEQIGVGQVSPEMQGLIDEFYRFNAIQQSAIQESADRIIAAGKTFFDDVIKAGADWKATIGAGGQRDPMVVQPAQRKASGGIIYAQNGSMVDFSPSGTDTVPAMLTPGEFVVNRKAASKNMGLLKAINNGSKRYSKGGAVYLAQGGVAPAISKEEVEKRIAELKAQQQAIGSYGQLPNGEMGFIPANGGAANPRAEEARYRQLQEGIDYWMRALAPAEQQQAPAPAAEAKPPELTRDFLIGGFAQQPQAGGARQPQPSQPNQKDTTPEQRIAAKRDAAKQAYLADKAQKRANFLANNPAYARQEKAKQDRAQQEQADALAWKQKQNEERGVRAPIDPRQSKDILQEYKTAKREERASKERLATYGTTDKLSPEQAREILDIKKGEALARKFNWKPDSVAGTYNGEDRFDPPEVMSLSQAERDALTKYQNIEIERVAKQEREQKAAERLAVREKEDAAFKSRLEQESKQRMAAFEEKRNREAQVKTEQEKAFKQRMADKETAFQANLAAKRQAEADKERERQKQVKTERDRKLSEEAIGLAQNDPSSIDTSGLSPEDKAEAAKQGVSEQKYAFEKNVDKFKTQLKDPTQISAETESIAARLRDVVSSNRAEISRLEEEKANQGWFSSLKEAVTLSDPYSQIISNAKQKASSAEYLLSELGQQQGLSNSERIALNSRMRSAYLTLIKNRPGESKQFQEMMDIENNAIDLTRDAVLDVGTAVIPAGGAVKAARGATKAASVAYRAGQAARVGASSGALSGATQGVFTGVEEGSVTTAITETVKGAATGALTGAAIPVAGAAAQGIGKTAGKAISAALPDSAVTKTGKTIVDKVGQAANFDATGYVKKKLAENDAMVEQRFQAWQKYEAQRIAKEKAARATTAAPAKRVDTAQSEWLRKNAPLQERSKKELEEAVMKGQEMAERFKAQGLEAPDFTKVNTAVPAKPATKTGGSARMSLKQAIAEADTDDIANKYGTGGEGKYGGRPRFRRGYDPTEDASPISAQDRKDLVESVQQARTAAQTRAAQDAAKKSAGDATPQQQMYAALKQIEEEKSKAASKSASRRRAVVGAAGAGAIAYYSDDLSKMIVSEEERRKQKGKKPKTMSSGGVVYAAKGQLIPFVPKGTDTVPAMLTPGEFVINRAATQKHLPLLKAINDNKLPGYAKGGKVQRFQYGGMADMSGGGGGGVSNISLDTSGLDTAFNSFATNVESLRSVIDSFASAATNISNGFSQLSQLDAGANRLGTAAASISSAAQTFGTVISNFNTSISALQSAFSKIPSAVDFRVSGSVPINITVDVNGGDGLQESLAQFQDQIFTEISNGISNAMPGVNISFTRTT